MSEILSDDGMQWLRDFEQKHGRRLRVLHIGNVANNGYNTAKLLRRGGIDADVLAFDYYHVMACPEWEEIELNHDWGDDFAPRFSPADLGLYQRPRWFVQGPPEVCASYLTARVKRLDKAADEIWRLLELARNGELGADDAGARAAWALFCAEIASESRLGGLALRASGWTVLQVRRAGAHLRHGMFLTARAPWRMLLGQIRIAGSGRMAGALRDRVRGAAAWLRRLSVRQTLLLGGRSVWRRSVPLVRIIAGENFVIALRHRILRILGLQRATQLSRFDELVAQFAAAFPNRADRLTLDDLSQWTRHVALFSGVFAEYDIIQAYGIDPILPLLIGNRPYVAFEHGTLRSFIRGDDDVSRLNALAYRLANHVFVTNGDCLEHAQWLGIERMSAMLHPIDVDRHELRDETGIAALRERHGADVMLFCPLRHDWEVKGTDVHLRALPQICERLMPRRVVLVLSPWGLQIDESRRLIAELGVSENVAWIERPLCRSAFVRYLGAADVVLDQMALPHFGGTAPQALAAGVPVIMSYRPDSTAWIVDQPAPILPAFNPSEVADAVVRALDPTWRAEFAVRARTWIYAHHHDDRVVREHLRVYRDIMETTPDILSTDRESDDSLVTMKFDSKSEVA
jgi:glycosyltransferase involved in cell wall biosynthesis